MEKPAPPTLNNQELRKRADFLAKELKRHNQLYFQDQAPEIEDSDFDRLQREYDEILAAHPEWRAAKDSPDQTVGAPPTDSGLAKVVREEPMLSLEKALSEEEIQDFAGRLAKRLGAEPGVYYTMPKFDGLAIELYYVDRRLTLAATRGDGREGENVTQNVLTIKNIPAKLPSQAPTGELVVRGEVYMEKAEFARLNEDRELNGLKIFANPRNAAAGSLKRLDAQVTDQRNLNFFAYGLVNPVGRGFQSYASLMAALADWGWPVENSSYSGPKANLEEVLAVFRALSQAREDLPFEVDGLVITLDDLTKWADLGLTARAPRWAVAAKFPPRLAETQVLAINVQVGRLGALTPVATVAPVRIGGATISQASLHNEDLLRTKDVRVGDWVVLKRAGDIIPDIVSVLKDKRDPNLQPFQFPSSCPICGHDAPRLEGEVSRKCSNFFCPARAWARLTHFASKNALDIEGLGPEIAELLLAEGLVKIPTDIFRLKKTQLENLPRLGPKSATNLIKAIDRARGAELWRFLNALSIPLVGETVSRALAERFLTLENLLAAVLKAKSLWPAQGAFDKEATKKAVQELGLPMVGPKILESLISFFTNEGLQDTLRDLMDPTLTQPASPQVGAGPLAGLKLVLTGALIKPRQLVKERLLAQGAKVLSAVSKETHLVLAGEDAGQKLVKAQALGLTIISEAQYDKMMAEDFLQTLADLPLAEKLDHLKKVFS
ncbi:MAG: NAD-dependent DNA ligase LigA [Deltaproteobacteria bacterium]|jgi:DNA ligase (NAD+)|nr:NAD-dependent DNA ligase LigA [Deltaproteobacteria bacterium]